VELKDLAAAKKNLEEIVAKYPGTNAAAIAIKRLNLLK
jgi:TolA-binding protein